MEDRRTLMVGSLQLVLGLLGFYLTWVHFPQKPSNTVVLTLFLAFLVITFWAVLGGLVNIVKTIGSRKN